MLKIRVVGKHKLHDLLAVLRNLHMRKIRLSEDRNVFLRFLLLFTQSIGKGTMSGKCFLFFKRAGTDIFFSILYLLAKVSQFSFKALIDLVFEGLLFRPCIS